MCRWKEGYEQVVAVSLVAAVVGGGLSDLTGQEASPVSSAQGEMQNAASWQTDIELGLNGAAGNASFLPLATGLKLARRVELGIGVEVAASTSYGRSDGTTIANRQEARATLQWLIESRLSGTLEVVGVRDVRRNVDLDTRIEGGIGWAVRRGSDAARDRLDIHVRGVGEYEDFATLTGDDARSDASETKRSSARVSFGFDLRQPLGEADAAVKAVWRPKASGEADHTLEAQGEVSTKLRANWSLVLRHSFLWDEVPPPGAVSTTDHRFEVLFRVAWGGGG